jgi:hypothetical protein
MKNLALTLACAFVQLNPLTAQGPIAATRHFLSFSYGLDGPLGGAR